MVAGSVGSVAPGEAESPVTASALAAALADSFVDRDVDDEDAAADAEVVGVAAPAALLVAGAGRLELDDAVGFGVGA